jgi:hypothetical protein
LQILYYALKFRVLRNETLLYMDVFNYEDNGKCGIFPFSVPVIKVHVIWVEKKIDVLQGQL